MKGRIRELRKALNMKQDVFAESINLTRNYISLVETGDRMLSDRSVSDICRVHNVSETWLRTGEGEMFLPLNKDEEVARFAEKMYQQNPSELLLKLLNAVAQLKDDEIETVVEIMRKVVDEYEKNSPN